MSRSAFHWLWLATALAAVCVAPRAAEQAPEPLGLPRAEWLRAPPVYRLPVSTPIQATPNLSPAAQCAALAAGDPAAYYRLGWLYFVGRGVARDPDRAADWFQRGAVAGDPLARHMLARLPHAMPQADDLCQRWSPPSATALPDSADILRALQSSFATDPGWAALLQWFLP